MPPWRTPPDVARCGWTPNHAPIGRTRRRRPTGPRRSLSTTTLRWTSALRSAFRRQVIFTRLLPGPRDYRTAATSSARRNGETSARTTTRTRVTSIQSLRINHNLRPQQPGAPPAIKLSTVPGARNAQGGRGAQQRRLPVSTVGNVLQRTKSSRVSCAHRAYHRRAERHHRASAPAEGIRRCLVSRFGPAIPTTGTQVVVRPWQAVRLAAIRTGPDRGDFRYDDRRPPLADLACSGSGQ